MIEFNCSGCGKKFKVGDSSAGRRGKCPQCGEVNVVPSNGIGGTHLPPQRRVEVQRPSTPIQEVAAAAYPAYRQPPLESGHVAHAPSVNIHMPKRASSLGVVSLILGLVAFLLCWIPFVGILSIPLSALGLILAIIGLCIAFARKAAGIGYPIGGGVVSALALCIAVAQAAAFGSAVTSVTSAIDESNRRQMRTNQEVVASYLPSESTTSHNNDTSARNPRAAPTPQVPQNGRDGSAAKWASARNSVRQGDIELRITQVVVGKVSVAGDFGTSESASQDDLLAIHLQLTNRSTNRKVDYHGWRGSDFTFSRDFATLSDNFGNSYKRVTFGFSTKVVGQTDSDSLYPGKSATDVLVFEPPIDTAEFLNLELPAANFGGEGMIRLRIPADMIQRK